MKTIAKKITSHALVWGIVAAVVVVAAATTLGVVASKRSKEAEVLTVSTLKEIVNVSELSTFTAVYNGIAKAMDEEEPDEIDYYVSYEARVNAGINFEKVEIQLDEDTKTIIVQLPEVTINDVIVDVASLEYIFLDDKENDVGVTEEAYKLCREDACRESGEQKAIVELAQENAENILTALTQPLIEQTAEEYTLKIEEVK